MDAPRRSSPARTARHALLLTLTALSLLAGGVTGGGAFDQRDAYAAMSHPDTQVRHVLRRRLDCAKAKREVIELLGKGLRWETAMALVGERYGLSGDELDNHLWYWHLERSGCAHPDALVRSHTATA